MNIHFHILIRVTKATLLLLFFCIYKSSGQEYLDTIEVTASKKTFTYDVKKDWVEMGSNRNIDTHLLKTSTSENISETLQKFSSVFTKNYGVNNIATFNIRGSSAAQNLLLWEGVPFNNIASGIADLSTINTFSIDLVQVQYGSNGSLYGSGNVGGAILLQNGFSNNNSGEVSTYYGSFRNWGINTKNYFSGKYGKMYIKLFYNNAINDFQYYNPIQQKDLVLTNAHKNIKGLNAGYLHHFFTFSSKKPLEMSFHTWVQELNREIPPALYENISTKKQKDNSFKNNLQFSQDIHEYINISSKLAWMHDEYTYDDDNTFFHQAYKSNNFYEEISLSNPNKIISYNIVHQFLINTSFQQQYLHYQNKESKYIQHKNALSLHYAIMNDNKSWSIMLNTRKEWVDNMNAPWTYGASGNYQLWHYDNNITTHNTQLKANIQSSFRAPTLNEWYIQPGGNKNLLPEESINKEVGIVSTTQYKNWKLHGNMNVYVRDVTNWIYWLGNTIWTPYNIAQVKSKGLDAQIKLIYYIKSHTLYAITDYAYTLATTSSSNLPNNNAIGKQIPYTPRYLLRQNIGWMNRKGDLININYEYAGYRFTNLDESSYLDPYQLVNISFKKHILNIGNNKIHLSFGINNLFNENYQSVKGRPMPMRNYTLNISMIY